LAQQHAGRDASVMDMLPEQRWPHFAAGNGGKSSN